MILEFLCKGKYELEKDISRIPGSELYHLKRIGYEVSRDRIDRLVISFSKVVVNLILNPMITGFMVVPMHMYVDGVFGSNSWSSI